MPCLTTGWTDLLALSTFAALAAAFGTILRSSFVGSGLSSFPTAFGIRSGTRTCIAPHAPAYVALYVRETLDVRRSLFSWLGFAPTEVLILPPSLPGIWGRVIGIVQVTDVGGILAVPAEGYHLIVDLFVRLEPVHRLHDSGLHGRRQDIHEQGSSNLLAGDFLVVSCPCQYLSFPQDQAGMGIFTTDFVSDDAQNQGR